MAFWSGEKLAARLPHLLGKHFNPDAVKCARYTMRIGAEAFVTSSKAYGGPKRGVTIPLKPNESFKIPPGQFAFLVTEESIEVPNDALALISIRTDLKFRGLVNVSGFHVDPGWKGHLKFGIYNAGSANVHLRRGQEMFLIWYADLDRTSEKTYKKSASKGGAFIPEEYASNMSGQIYSPQVLAGLIRRLENKLIAIYYIAGAILAAAILIAVTNWLNSEPKAAERQFILVPQVAPWPTSSMPTTSAGQPEGRQTANTKTNGALSAGKPPDATGAAPKAK
jgi:dCTP deaminase